MAFYAQYWSYTRAAAINEIQEKKPLSFHPKTMTKRIKKTTQETANLSALHAKAKIGSAL